MAYTKSVHHLMLGNPKPWNNLNGNLLQWLTFWCPHHQTISRLLYQTFLYVHINLICYDQSILHITLHIIQNDGRALSTVSREGESLFTLIRVKTQTSSPCANGGHLTPYP